VPHTSRAQFARPLPLHVTIRVADPVYNLRSRRSFGALAPAIYDASNRLGVRILQFSIQGNHIHLLIEAADRAALYCGVKGLSVRIAKRMNALMRRRGRVIGDRYHARGLRTPTEVRRVATDIRENYRRHARARGERLPGLWVDPYTSDATWLAARLPQPRTWLARTVLTGALLTRAGPD
jgi:REP element-mobilizing transposase RayT